MDKSLRTGSRPYTEGVFKTITADNGGENALWSEVEKVCEGVKFYFCDPFKSYQKGAVERANKDLRVFYSKGTDWENVSTSNLEFHTRITTTDQKSA